MRIASLLSLSFAAAITLSGCKAEPSADVPSNLTILATRSLATPEFYMISRLLVTPGGNLVILDASAPYLTVFDPNRDSMVYQQGETGEGPGELIGPSGLDIAAAPDSGFWVMEGSRRRWTFFDPAGLRIRSVTFSSKAAALDAVLLPSGMIVSGIADGPGSVFAGDTTLDANLNWLGVAPYRKADFPEVRLVDNRARLAVDPSRQRIAIAFRYAPEIQVVSAQGELLHRWHRPGGIGEPRTAYPGSQSPTFSSDSSDHAYHAVAAWEGGVVAAYCGCQGHQRMSLDSMWIDAFTWEDGYLGSFRAPGPIRAMAINPGGSKLYLALNSPEPTILELEPARLR
jgi:hypothetical protein